MGDMMDFMMLDPVIDTSEVEENISHFQQWLNETGDWFLGYIPHLITAILVLVAGWWLIKLVIKIMTKALNKSKADLTIISFLTSVTKTVLFIFLGVSVLSALQFDVSTLITALGAAAVTVGLAIKDSLANVASGTLIILNRKFKTGDYIETEGIVGEVMKIDMMYTTLRTYDHKEVLIPNSRLSTNNIINHFNLEDRRLEIPVSISYEEDIAKARSVIMELIKGDKRVLQEKPNKVIVEQFGESSVDLKVWIWCVPQNYWALLFDMREGIKNALDKAGIEIPFNQLDIHLDDFPEITEKVKERST